jgi:HK97 gp10 family phage protein
LNGFADVASALNAAVLRTPGKLSLAIKKTAFDLEGRAATRAPYRTGNLKTSIKAHILGPMTASVGPTAHYGRYVEEGTSRMAAQPYLMPALDDVMPNLLEAARQIVEGMVND